MKELAFRNGADPVPPRFYHVIYYRAIAIGGAGVALAPPVFGLTVNPISSCNK